MKINESNSIKKVSFQGHQHEKTESGEEAYRFNCLYDKNKYDCEVQFFKVGQDKKNNFFIEKGCNGTMEHSIVQKLAIMGFKSMQIMT